MGKKRVKKNFTAKENSSLSVPMQVIDEPTPAQDDPSYLDEFEKELVLVFHKNQDTFEKQLSFISSGALVLSIGFMKDILPMPIAESKLKLLLGIGWGLLILTLLLNLISHLVGAKFANSAIKEIRENNYQPEKIIQRNRSVIDLNWASVISMILGIFLITIYIVKNLLK